MIRMETALTGVVEMLRSETGRPVGDGATPPGSGDQRYPFSIVYPIPGGGWAAGQLEHHGDYAVAIVQVSSVGRRRDQTSALMDRVREAMLDHDVKINDSTAGQDVLLREPDGGPGGIDPSGQPPHRLFTGAERFRVHLSSA